MTKFFNIILFVSMFILFSCSNPKMDILEELKIDVTGSNREFFFTNKISAFYYANTNEYSNSGWFGWTVNEKKLLHDYSIFSDNNLLERKEAKVSVYPHKIVRKYRNSIQEIFSLADSVDAILLNLVNASSKISLKFHFADKVKIKEQNDNSIILETEKNNFILLTSFKFNSASAKEESLTLEFNDTKEIKLILQLTDYTSNNILTIDSFENLIEKKGNRIKRLLENSYTETNDKNFDKALMWNKITLDALITYQGSVNGIWAGLPWFNNYWGRDTFISLPGATFYQNNFEDAKKILLSFSEHQELNPRSEFFGRIPNRITLNEKIYNTADGTPWFVIQAYNYILHSGDTEFINKIYNTIKIATNSNLEKRTDKNLFLIHKDAETWMDAVGPKGPWSPRGNRANDIQALWFRQLVISSYFAKIIGDLEQSKRWEDAAIKLRDNFNEYFINKKDSIIYDHLKADNSPSNEIRPNAFFPLITEDLILEPDVKLNILNKYVNELVFPYGVLSLSPNDSNFHPYHHYQPFYVQDAAYHNGIIWLWNSGPVISSLNSFHLSNFSYQLTETLTDITLNRFAVGTLPELLDAFPRENKTFPDASGTFTQAWSMAEFIRNFYEDYLGIEVDALKKIVFLIPSLPDKINYAKSKIKIGDSYIIVEYKKNDQNFEVNINTSELKDSIDIAMSLVNQKNVNYMFKFQLLKNEFAKLTLDNFSEDLSGIKLTVNEKLRLIKVSLKKDPEANQPKYQNIKFAVPKFNPNWKSIQQPSYLLLKNNDIKKSSAAAKIILSIDDKNVIKNNYTLPKNPNFAEGITDFEKLNISADNENYYFEIEMKKLVNPGWHNEYGFQLTFISIALRTDIEEVYSSEIKNNSEFILDKGYEFNRLINIGGGIEVFDGNHKKIAQYLPEKDDYKNPLGNTKTNKITFALPRNLLGNITDKTKITVLVGTQDDHGGAGIGEFRSVEKVSTEWTGGGKTKSKSNVFEYLKIN